MTPTDLPSPAPDRAVADVLSEAREALERAQQTLTQIADYFGKQGDGPGRYATLSDVARLDDALARLSDALSQPVAQPEGLSEAGNVVVYYGERYVVEFVEAMVDGHAEWLARLAPLPGEPRQEGEQPCPCWTCQTDAATNPLLIGMVVCEHCGNKRCPHATHHDNDCTGSNELGQPGSRYAAPLTDHPRLSEGEE